MEITILLPHIWVCYIQRLPQSNNSLASYVPFGRLKAPNRAGKHIARASGSLLVSRTGLDILIPIPRVVEIIRRLVFRQRRRHRHKRVQIFTELPNFRDTTYDRKLCDIRRLNRIRETFLH